MSQLGIGKKVRKLRERKAWTQEHLAKAADVSLRTVQRAEDGVMSAETLSALAGALDLPVEQLSYDESGYPAVTPFLFYANGDTFDWLVTAFGFTARMKHQGAASLQMRTATAAIRRKIRKDIAGCSRPSWTEASAPAIPTADDPRSDAGGPSRREERHDAREEGHDLDV
jgi:transcriptional regulator with XRE-family HTH domain